MSDDSPTWDYNAVSLSIPVVLRHTPEAPGWDATVNAQIADDHLLVKLDGVDGAPLYTRLPIASLRWVERMLAGSTPVYPGEGVRG